MATARYVVNFRVGDRVNFIDPTDSTVGTVIEIKRYKFSNVPHLRVQYPGQIFTGPTEAFTLVERPNDHD